MLPKLEVLCVGETMALFAPAQGQRLVDGTRFELHVAGAESTVALYLAEAGHRTAWASNIGADPLGDRILGQLSDQGVNTSLVQRVVNAPTGLYLKDTHDEMTSVYYYRERSAASLL